MTIRRSSRIAGATLCGLLLSSSWASAQGLGKADGVPGDDTRVMAERMREAQQKLLWDHEEVMRKMRARRAALESKLAAERKQEAERARQQAASNAAALATAKEAMQRQALEAAQAQARREAEARAAQAECERAAALKALRDEEERLAREQKAAEEAAKKGGTPQLGGETRFGVDI